MLAVWERRDGAHTACTSFRVATGGDQSPTAPPRALPDIYSPLSHYRPCLNQLYLAKTFKIASFIRSGSSRARWV